MARPAKPLPPVTDEHRRRAFALFCWPGVTFEAAMAVDMRRRLIEARAAHIRKQDQQLADKADHQARRAGWCQQAIFGARVRPVATTPAPDLKRLAAHDLDD